MLKLRSTQICLQDPQVYTPEPGAPAASGVGSRARFPARDDIFGASFVVGSRARAPPCIPALSFTAVAKVPTGRNLGGGNMLGEIAQVIASNCTPGKGKKSGPRRKPSCLMFSGYQPALRKGAILRAPLI